MDVPTLVTSAAVSATVSGAIAFTFKTFLKAAIENRYSQELEALKKQHTLEIERLKADLAVKTNTEREVTERRFLAYPKLVSLVYRMRNMCRDIAGHLSEGNLSLVEELASRVKDLEEALYDFRFDLERDRIFDDIHAFKNRVIGFNIRAADAKYFIEEREHLRAQAACKELGGIFDEIEARHRHVIESLTDHVPSEPKVSTAHTEATI
jgi:hypothetical protein